MTDWYVHGVNNSGKWGCLGPTYILYKGEGLRRLIRGPFVLKEGRFGLELSANSKWDNFGLFLENKGNKKIFTSRYTTGNLEYVNSVGLYKDIAVPSC